MAPRPANPVDDIPVAHTPPGGYGETLPDPILSDCHDPLVDGAPDLRGLWLVVEVLAHGDVVGDHAALGHVQRIEQCGDRLVVTAGGVIHDMRCDGTREHGVHDVAEFDKQTPITVVATYEDGVHVLRPEGIPIEVTRRREGPDMIWDYLGFRAAPAPSSTDGDERMTEPRRRVALITDASFYVGPHLARALAARGHDLVLGDPPEELVAELSATGASVEAVAGVRDISKPEASERIVAAALTRFGRIDAAAASSGRVITGRFLRSSVDDLHAVVRGCLEAPYHFLRAVIPVMVEQGDGQALLITSAAGARTTPGAPLYSAARAGATMLARNVAAEVAPTGVQVNVVGTNFMDFPEFLRANGVTDAESRAKVEARVPMRRLGTLEEFAAFCMAFVDGTSGFTTGQFVAYAGGWV